MTGESLEDEKTHDKEELEHFWRPLFENPKQHVEK